MKFEQYDLVIVGGGAAGFFGGIQAAQHNPSLKILIAEKTSKVLSKVRVSGGGRCNVTHNCFESRVLSHHYPRGEKSLKQLFKKYQAKDVVDWFSKKGVELVAEEDGRMFPETNDSQTIIDCFVQEVKRLKIEVVLNKSVVKIDQNNKDFIIHFGDSTSVVASNILVTVGGHANPHAYDFISALGHTIIKPIPSLFTFNDSKKTFKDLMGISVPNAEVKIAGSKFSQRGPLLITHWGLSGPSVIKLSAWAAEHLHALQYEFNVLVSWIGAVKEDDIRQNLLEHKKIRGQQKVTTNPLFNLPQRLWQRLCEIAEVENEKIWSELPQKNINKLLECIIRCPFQIKGKTTFKEEFVTCGGVDLKEVDLETMESKLVKNLFFAGEVLNIDGETGGFNFQAAWTTAYVVSQALIDD